jgi:hypothetical protein
LRERNRRSGISGFATRLTGDERREQSDRGGAEGERLSGSPALLGDAEDSVHAEHQAPDEQRRARDIGSGRQPDPLAIRDQPDREHRGRESDGQVDEEDPMPVDRLGQNSARQQPDRPAGDGDERVSADRLRLLPGVREHRHDHPEDHGGGQRPANALDEARADQQALALGQRAEQRRDGEHSESDEEDPPLPDQVAKTPRQQQQAAERDQVGVDHPGEVALREAEILSDRRQGNVYDRRIEDDHQHPEAQHVQRQPPPAVLGSGGLVSAGGGLV